VRLWENKEGQIPDQFGQFAGDGVDLDVVTALAADSLVKRAHRSRRFSQMLGGFRQKPPRFRPSVFVDLPVARRAVARLLGRGHEPEVAGELFLRREALDAAVRGEQSRTDDLSYLLLS
jgi:hypothetical protein